MYLVTVDNIEHGVGLVEKARGVWIATRTDGTKTNLELRGRDGKGHFVVRVNGVDRKVEVHRNGAYRFLEGGNTHIFEFAYAADVVLDELGARQPEHHVEATHHPRLGVRA